MSRVVKGKLPPKRYYGEVGVKFASYYQPKKLLAHAPSTHQTWGGHVDFLMYLNDEAADCTCASLGHAEQLQSYQAGAPETPTDAAIWELYHTTGVEQGFSDEDGRYMEDVAKHYARVGIIQGDGSYERALGYAAVNYLDHAEVMAAAWLFGGLYFGAALPLSAQDQLDAGRAWSVSRDKSKNAPGSWGGHAMWLSGYIKRGPRSITWGERQQMTWSWWDQYVDECYAVVTPDWTQREKAPSGFMRDELVSMLKDLNG